MDRSITGRVFLVLGLLNLFILFAAQAFSEEVRPQEIQIVEIKKNLQLKNGDTVFHDYYLNAGTENGLKPNTSFEVFRKVAINDLYQSNSKGGTVLLPVGRIKIIYSQTKLSVARLLSLNKPKDSPLVDSEGLMVGDVLNIGSVELVQNDEPKAAVVEATPQKLPKKLPKIVKNKKPKKIEKALEELKKEEAKIIITPPIRTVEVSKSIPVEILNLPSRAPASVEPPVPQVRVVR